MRKLHPILLLAVLVFPIRAEPLHAAEREEPAWRQLADTLARRPQTPLAGRFVQERVTPLLAEPLVSVGTVRLAEGLVRFDTDPPYPSTMLIEHDTVTLYDPDARSAERYPLAGEQGPLAELLRGELDPLRQRYDLDLSTSESGTVTATLRPTDDGDTPAVFSFTFGTEHGGLRASAVDDGEGGLTRLGFVGIEPVPGLTAQDLRLDLPEGVDLADYTGKTP